MSMLDAVLQALARTEALCERQREGYDAWWRINDAFAELKRLGGEDEETTEQAAMALRRIHGEQAERVAIRHRLCDGT